MPPTRPTRSTGNTTERIEISNTQRTKLSRARSSSPPINGQRNGSTGPRPNKRQAVEQEEDEDGEDDRGEGDKKEDEEEEEDGANEEEMTPESPSPAPPTNNRKGGRPVPKTVQQQESRDASPEAPAPGEEEDQGQGESPQPTTHSAAASQSQSQSTSSRLTGGGGTQKRRGKRGRRGGASAAGDGGPNLGDESEDEAAAGASSSAAAGGSGTKDAVPRFKCVNRIKEQHGMPLYIVCFNTIDTRHSDIFASAGANRVTVYRALAGGQVDPLQLYVDEDPAESLYALTWSIDLRTGSSLLLIGGEGGIIKIIDLHTRRIVRRLVGHGSSINELKVHPRDLNLLLSVSKDMSVRLWNLSSGDCIAIFAGDEGHRDQVLSGDFHSSGNKIISSGMDHSIMIWNLDTPAIQSSIAYSYLSSHSRSSSIPFPTVLIQYPAFKTNEVHTNYVDHVRWLGEFILSKSTEAKICLWKIRTEQSGSSGSSSSASTTTMTKKKSSPHKLLEYQFSDCDIWYIRFCMDVPNLQYLAVGNKIGEVFVWRTDTVPVPPPRKLTTPHSSRAIRCVGFNTTATILLAACEDGTLFRWDQVPEKNSVAQHQLQLHSQKEHSLALDTEARLMAEQQHQQQQQQQQASASSSSMSASAHGHTHRALESTTSPMQI